LLPNMRSGQYVRNERGRYQESQRGRSHYKFTRKELIINFKIKLIKNIILLKSANKELRHC
jgi:hypothetical protein